jgi:hypothetical protein
METAIFLSLGVGGISAPWITGAWRIIPTPMVALLIFDSVLLAGACAVSGWWILAIQSTVNAALYSWAFWNRPRKKINLSKVLGRVKDFGHKLGIVPA